MNNHPERMILIAVLVAAALWLVGSVVSCATLVPVVGRMQAASSTFPSNPEWWLEQNPDFLEDELNELYGDLENGPNQGFTESDLPAKMEIDEEELRDDLEAFVNVDLRRHVIESEEGSQGSSSSSGKDEDKDVSPQPGKDTEGVSLAKVTKFALESTTDPRLVNGQILSEAKGKATIEYQGETAEVDVTSYYYCEDPHANKLIWYIYGYDLGDYGLFPKDFGKEAGDPYEMRDWMLEGGATAGSSANFSRDNRHNAEAA